MSMPEERTQGISDLQILFDLKRENCRLWSIFHGGSMHTIPAKGPRFFVAIYRRERERLRAEIAE